MSEGHTRRVLVYTASLLLAPLPVMPFEKGTRQFALGLLACGLILTLSSLHLARAQLRLRHRGLLGTKLLTSSLITLAFGASIFLGSIVYLCLPD